jgi:predicted TIM-barrel fold metal-dependent hydrolase
VLNAPSAGPFVDAHVHFWDRAVEGLRWRFLEPDFEHPRLGGLKKLRAPRYAVSELRSDQAGCDVSKVVHVQAAQSDDPVRETAWLQDLGDREGWPTAIVGYAISAGRMRVTSWPATRGFRGFAASGTCRRGSASMTLMWFGDSAWSPRVGPRSRS